MSDLAVSNSFTAGTTISASAFNANNTTDIAGYINARNQGTAPWDFLNVSSSSAVALIADNLTGANSIASFRDNGTSVFEINDGGDVSFNSNSYTRLYKSTGTQSIGLTAAKVTFDSVTQTQIEGDTVNSRVTVIKSGTYLLQGVVRVTFTTGLVAGRIMFYKNGVEISRGEHPDADGLITQSSPNHEDLVRLNAGDYIELFCRFEGPGTETVQSDAAGTFTFLTVTKLA